MAKPDWHPTSAGKEYATIVVEGKNSTRDESGSIMPKVISELTLEEIKSGVLNCDRMMLGKAITLIESKSSRHFDKAQSLLSELLPYSGNSFRIGITGSPGVGKSTIIESLGTYLCSIGHKVAVLAIDPSSSRSRGSILGDKTRMELLSREDNAFIRPSPSGGFLGGVTRRTRETIILCEAAGYDVILIETVGVGQSEISVRSMVDLFLLLLLPGGGDDLQGIKKGVVELADIIMINKSDGDNLQLANLTRQYYETAVHYLQNATPNWSTRIITGSALNNTGIVDFWNIANEFLKIIKVSNTFNTRRQLQLTQWFESMINEELTLRFYNNDKVKRILASAKQSILSGEVTPTLKVQELLDNFFGK